MFREGKTGAKDLANFFEDSMGDAAMSIFKNKVLADAMEKFYKRFTEVSQSEEGLTADSIATLKRDWMADTEAKAKEWAEWQKVTGIDTNKGSQSQSGISRSISTCTEKSMIGMRSQIININHKQLKTI